MQFKSSRLHNPVSAESINEAVLKAAQLLGEQMGGEAKISGVDYQPGNQAACTASITTMKKVFRNGSMIETEVSESIPFMISPVNHMN